MLKKWKPRSVWEDENSANATSSTKTNWSWFKSSSKSNYAAEELKTKPIRRVFIATIAVLATTLLALLVVATQEALSRTTAASSTTITTATTVTQTTTMTTTTTTSVTTTTTTLTTTTPACNPSARGIIMTLSGSTPSSWTQYRLNYTATTTTLVLMFGFQNENNRYYRLDSVSVVNQDASSVELLTNPSFESSSSSATNWVQWCTSTCGGLQGIIVSDTNCHLGSGNCFKDSCAASNGIDFLAQPFTASINNKYTISFWLLLDGAGTTASNKFYVDIV